MLFISLFKRYLSSAPSLSPARAKYPWYTPSTDLLAYCLMPNHFHLLLYQRADMGISNLMQSIMISYSMYFNRKYKRVGPVFQSKYKASEITKDNYLEHISRYIHLNPLRWENYPYSSLRYYLGSTSAEWIKPDKILRLFPSREQYMEFVRDYESHKEMLEELQWELADS